MPGKLPFGNNNTTSSLQPFNHRANTPATIYSKVGSQNVNSEKLVIVMVGLPARGKSYVTKKLCRYLSWLQYDTKIFNVGDRRRKIGRQHTKLPIIESESVQAPETTTDLGDHSANFFDPENEEASQLRERAAMGTLDELLDYLFCGGGCVAIFDATNSTVKRRNLIMKKIRSQAPNLQVMFLESQCFDEQLLESNMRLKLSGPDFRNQDPVLALEDFKKRVVMYEKQYVPLGISEESSGYSYCQMIDVGRKFVIHSVSGFLATEAVHYLQHFNLLPRQIWLTRHGESHDDVAGRIGGDAELTPNGVRYSEALSRFINYQRDAWDRLQQETIGSHDDVPHESLQRGAPTDHAPKKFHVWTSTMQRSIQTAQNFYAPEYQTRHLRMLDELNAGVLEGLTREEVKDFHADWFHHRQTDKFHFRYPGTAGEGYLDVTNRLKSVILRVESETDHVLLISGLAVTRILLAYFRGLHRDDIVNLYVPLGTLHVLEPKPYGVDYRVYMYNSEMNWFDLKEE